MNSQLYLIEKEIKAGNITIAESLCWEGLIKDPNNFLIKKALGLCLLMQKKISGAIKIYEEILIKHSEDFDSNNNIAQLYFEIEELDKAKLHIDKAIKKNPESHLPYLTLSDLYVKLRDFNKAVDAIEKSIKIIGNKERYAFIHQLVFNYADALIALDKKDRAISFTKECFEISKDTTIFYFLMNLKSDIYSRKEIDNFVDDTLKKKYLSEAKAHLALAPLYFGLGRYSEKSDKKLSEECYLQANRHSSLVQRFNPLQHQKHIKNIKKIYLESLGKKLDTDDLGEGIIFIVGMPRSGTTLIESMLASNEQVISGGEMISMAELFKTHYEDEVSIPDFKKIGVAYNNRIKPIKRDYAFFIDKLPANYYHIGLILLSMPKAKFIHIHREPWDIAISLFKQLYIANIPFSSKFFSVACTIANYQHMTGFWNEELDDNRIMNLQYEDVVKNPKDSAKILYNFIGIKGEVNMKERSKFFSRTASKTQIQSNIHTKSLGKDDFADFKNQFYDDLESQKNYWK